VGKFDADPWPMAHAPDRTTDANGGRKDGGLCEIVRSSSRTRDRLDRSTWSPSVQLSNRGRVHQPKELGGKRGGGRATVACVGSLKATLGTTGESQLPSF
jgi:hypothetical protein